MIRFSLFSTVSSFVFVCAYFFLHASLPITATLDTYFGSDGWLIGKGECYSRRANIYTQTAYETFHYSANQTIGVSVITTANGLPTKRSCASRSRTYHNTPRRKYTHHANLNHSINH